jgi:hypothetical protein
MGNATALEDHPEPGRPHRAAALVCAALSAHRIPKGDLMKLQKSFGLGAALFVIGLPLCSSAFAWGDKAAQVWVERNNAIIAAASQPIDGVAPPEARVLHSTHRSGFSSGYTAEETAQERIASDFYNGLAAACDGLTMEHIKNGGRNMPVWAQTAQQRVCLSAEDLKHAYKDKAHDKSRCKSLESAIKYAKKAEKGDDPDAVVESAAALIAAAESLRAVKIELIQKGVFGDGKRMFDCD